MPTKPAKHIFSPGQHVLVDDRYMGEIIHIVSHNGFWRVEVDTDKEKHEYWTVSEARLQPYPAPNMPTKPTATAHTPGPWIVVDGPADDKYPYPGIYAEKAVCTIIEPGDCGDTHGIKGATDDAALANARLIAAAPTMYDALEAVLADIKEYGAVRHNVSQQVRAALSAATGGAK